MRHCSIVFLFCKKKNVLVQTKYSPTTCLELHIPEHLIYWLLLYVVLYLNYYLKVLHSTTHIDSELNQSLTELCSCFFAGGIKLQLEVILKTNFFISLFLPKEFHDLYKCEI